MQIRNFSTGEILAEDAKECKGLMKAIGLRFSKNSKKEMFFDFGKEKIETMDMFFVKFQIDIIFLNKEKNVVEIKENFKPFTKYTTKEKIQYAIEVPAGTAKKTRTNLGNKIAF